MLGKTHAPLPLPPPMTCPRHHDSLNFLLSIMLTVGIVLSYTPQHYKILKIKSSEGISPYYLLLGGISCTSTVFNLILLQWPVVLCCSAWSVGVCFENVLGIIQVVSQWCMFALMITLYLTYFPPSRKYIPVYPPFSPLLLTSSPSNSPSPSRLPENMENVMSRPWKVSLTIAFIVASYFLICLALSIVSLILFNNDAEIRDERVIAFAGVLGGIATLMSMFQFLPQIIKTYRRKAVGAVSISMMCMQTPGTIVLVYSLSLRPNTNISTYLSYIASATLQGILLCLCLYYSYLENRDIENRLIFDDGEAGPEDERSRLLREYESDRSRNHSVSNSRKSSPTKSTTSREHLIGAFPSPSRRTFPSSYSKANSDGNRSPSVLETPRPGKSNFATPTKVDDFKARDENSHHAETTITSSNKPDAASNGLSNASGSPRKKINVQDTPKDNMEADGTDSLSTLKASTANEKEREQSMKEEKEKQTDSVAKQIKPLDPAIQRVLSSELISPSESSSIVDTDSVTGDDLSSADISRSGSDEHIVQSPTAQTVKNEASKIQLADQTKSNDMSNTDTKDKPGQAANSSNSSISSKRKKKKGKKKKGKHNW